MKLLFNQLLACSLVLFTNSPSLAAQVRAYPARENEVKRGFYFCMARTLLSVPVKYNIYRVTTWTDTERTRSLGRNYMIAVEDPVQPAPLTVADKKTSFRIETRKLASFAVESTTDFELNPNGTLKKASATFDDKSDQMVTDLAETTANVAATIAKSMAAGLITERPVAKVEVPSDPWDRQGYGDIEFKLIGTVDRNYIIDVDGLVEADRAESNAKEHHVTTVEAKLLDKRTKELIAIAIRKDGWVIGQDSPKVKLPGLEVSITVESDPPQNAQGINARYNENWWTKHLSFFREKSYLNGVPARAAGECAVTIMESSNWTKLLPKGNLIRSTHSLAQGGTGAGSYAAVGFTTQPVATSASSSGDKADEPEDLAKPELLLRTEVPFLQYGSISVIPMTSGIFLKRVHTVEFGDNNTLSKVGENSDSRGARITAMLKSASKTLEPTGQVFGQLLNAGGKQK